MLLDSKKESILLSDFSEAILDDSTRLTDIPGGTYGYMAPERFSKYNVLPEKPNEKTDLWYII